MSNALRKSLLIALQDRKDNCERTAKMYLADNSITAAAQCRAAAGAVEECIEAVENIMLEPAHICGLSGYNPIIDPPCQGCAWRAGESA